MDKTRKRIKREKKDKTYWKDYSQQQQRQQQFITLTNI
jgi:hypothetical protein